MIIEYVSVLLLFHVLVFWLQDTCVLSSPTGFGPALSALEGVVLTLDCQGSPIDISAQCPKFFSPDSEPQRDLEQITQCESQKRLLGSTFVFNFPAVLSPFLPQGPLPAASTASRSFYSSAVV